MGDSIMLDGSVAAGPTVGRKLAPAPGGLLPLLVVLHYAMPGCRVNVYMHMEG